ncbi:Ribosome biogenesis ATPase Rix7 [Malassezia pachydermatis]|uniref:Ribosome biogenesis atpase rix7 n=1 Tax=Malassezia pachydermatis TaxID=77020 RepID=A0A0M9VR06_9BASI|nr:ribosome biogenesis atpase rix7 [Malassezia pachydermatis]KOS16112.1 ribosome biogenesis atpase rix7 [Malassezia pachydermatis]
MNAAITGAWSKQRTRISLNTAVPPAGSAAAAAQARAESKKDDDTDTVVDKQERVGKRKVRASRTPDQVSKRGKTKSVSKEDKYAAPMTRLRDIGGASAAIEKALELIAMPLCHPEIYLHTGVTPPRGVLFHGPPGCGKTMMAGALAGELGVPFLSISAPSIVSGTSGESEKALRDTFEEAQKIAPCILFVDEIDAITPKRETAQREMERRIVAQLLTCMDELAWEKGDGRPVMILGATNRPDSIDPALRRAGRFDHEIAMGVPDEEGREHILQVLCSKLRLAGDFDFKYLAKRTPGFVGADLTSLTAAAGIIAVKRIFQHLQDIPALNEDMQCDDTQEAADMEAAMSVPEVTDDAEAPETIGEVVKTPVAEEEMHVITGPQFLDTLPDSVRSTSIATFLQRFPHPLPDAQLEKLAITNQDFLDALKVVQPSSKREGFATVPDVTWDDIGALHQIREELSMAVVQPIRRPELFRALGVSASSGVLLWGPPGCGKTLLAKAVANESRANFISVKGPELLNKYVGESEKAVRQVFARARASSPCVIFFDELDALVPRRDDTLSESSARVVNTLLTELDGLESRVQTYVIAATNRPDMIDPAMCRPGRLDRLLYVDLPTSDERLDILRTLTKVSPLATEDEADGERHAVQLDQIAHDHRADGYSGADLAALVREAAVTALREKIASPLQYNDDTTAVTERVCIYHHHFVHAFDRVQPSVSTEQRLKYEALRGHIASGAGRAR